MIDFYFWPTPNGKKIALALEEMELAYRLCPVNIGAGEQHAESFLAISPNNRIPAIVDHDVPAKEGHAVFESGAILLYLAEKTGIMWPTDKYRRSVVLQWLFFQCSNLGPMFGQCNHFRCYAPEKIEYGIERYCGESRKLYSVMDKRLRDHAWLAGDSCSLADLATYPWCAPQVREMQQIDIEAYPHVKKWCARMIERPGVARGMQVGES